MNIAQLIAQEFSIGLNQAQNALTLFADGRTLSFIARYREEKTGEIN
jgi:uncharacterized protein